MPFTGSGWTAGFRSDLLQAKHNFNAGGDTIKLALYTNAATLDVMNTTSYTVAGEVTDSTYNPGGNVLTSLGVMVNGQGAAFGVTPGGLVAWVSFSPVVWPAAAFTCRGALIYNHSKGDAAIAILDFGSDQVMNGTDFTLSFDTGNPNLSPVQLR